MCIRFLRGFGYLKSCSCLDDNLIGLCLRGKGENGNILDNVNRFAKYLGYLFSTSYAEQK